MEWRKNCSNDNVNVTLLILRKKKVLKTNKTTQSVVLYLYMGL